MQGNRGYGKLNWIGLWKIRTLGSKFYEFIILQRIHTFQIGLVYWTRAISRKEGFHLNSLSFVAFIGQKGVQCKNLLWGVDLYCHTYKLGYLSPSHKTPWCVIFPFRALSSLWWQSDNYDSSENPVCFPDSHTEGISHLISTVLRSCPTNFRYKLYIKSLI